MSSFAFYLFTVLIQLFFIKKLWNELYSMFIEYALNEAKRTGQIYKKLGNSTVWEYRKWGFIVRIVEKNES